MAIARTQKTTAAEDAGPSPHLFTVDEYYKMGEIGIFDEDSRVELIDGVIYDMPPIGPEHAGSFEQSAGVLRDALGTRASVRHQNPLHVGDRSEPQPDLVIVRRRSDFYRSAHPAPDDVLLIFEIADSSLTHDRNIKASAYARAGIREYWILDLRHGVLIVHRDPSEEGYGSVQQLKRGDTVTLVVFPDVTIAVADVLG